MTKKPKPKQAGVQVTPVGKMQDDGSTVLQIGIINASPDTTSVHYAEDVEVSEASPKLSDDKLSTRALKVAFLAVDHSGRTQKGAPHVWSNKLLIQWEIAPAAQGKRTVTLTVLPRADVVRYTLNGAEPRNGVDYTAPFTVGPDAAMLLVYAEASGLEAKAEYRIPQAAGTGGGGGGGGGEAPPPPLNKPVAFPTQRNAQVTSREKVFAALAKATERNIAFTDVVLRIQDGAAFGQFGLQGQTATAARVQQALATLAEGFGPATPVTMQFRAQFPTGQDLIDFAALLELAYAGEWKELE